MLANSELNTWRHILTDVRWETNSGESPRSAVPLDDFALVVTAALGGDISGRLCVAMSMAIEVSAGFHALAGIEVDPLFTIEALNLAFASGVASSVEVAASAQGTSRTCRDRNEVLVSIFFATSGEFR